MINYEHSVSLLTEEFEDLSQEIYGMLESTDSALAQAMESGGYYEKLLSIKENAQILIEQIRGRLQELSHLSEERPLSGKATDQTSIEVRELLELMSDLLGLWDRLDSLVSMIELKASDSKPDRIGMISKVRSWLSDIRNWLVKVSKRLWDILCRLMTPKEWKLSGNVGTGPLGLADVGIEITFGK